jgi:hypothetical protein
MGRDTGWNSGSHSGEQSGAGSRLVVFGVSVRPVGMDLSASPA